MQQRQFSTQQLSFTAVRLYRLLYKEHFLCAIKFDSTIYDFHQRNSAGLVALVLNNSHKKHHALQKDEKNSNISSLLLSY